MGGQGRCEQRSEVFVKIEKNGVGSGGGGFGLGGQGGCERRIEVFEKIHFFYLFFFWGGGSGRGVRGRLGGGGSGQGGRVGGVRVDVNVQMKFL